MVGQDRIEKDTETHQGRRLMVDESTHELLHTGPPSNEMRALDVADASIVVVEPDNDGLDNRK